MAGTGDRLVGLRGPRLLEGREGRVQSGVGWVVDRRQAGWLVAEDPYLCYVPPAGRGSSQPPCTVHSRADA